MMIARAEIRMADEIDAAQARGEIAGEGEPVGVAEVLAEPEKARPGDGGALFEFSEGRGERGGVEGRRGGGGRVLVDKGCNHVHKLVD